MNSIWKIYKKLIDLAIKLQRDVVFIAIMGSFFTGIFCNNVTLVNSSGYQVIVPIAILAYLATINMILFFWWRWPSILLHILFGVMIFISFLDISIACNRMGWF